MEGLLPVHPRQPRSAVIMENEFKNRASGVIEDRLPSQYAVPRNELMPNKHERMLMQGSTLYRKRTRKPKVDLLENPACVDRQLRDAYESMRVNRNPALYRPTKADISKSTSLLDQFDKNIKDSDVNSLKVSVLESVGAHEAAIQINRDIHDGIITKQPIDQTLAPASIPHFNTYTKGSTITNGHGPTYGQSHAPRIFNPLTKDLTRKSKEPSHGAGEPIGVMTIAQLRDLLKQPSQQGNKNRGGKQSIHSNRSSFSNNSDGKSQTAPASLNRSESFISSINYDIGDIDSSSKNIQPKWDSSFASEAYIYETSKGMPHPGVSMLARDSAMDDTFREKLLRSRASAAGTLLLERDLCVERQKLDLEDYALSASGHVRCQDILNEKLSPRRDYQRDEVKKLIHERKIRDEKAARRVAKYELEETLSRIPKPKPLTKNSSSGVYKNGGWDGSYIINDPGY